MYIIEYRFMSIYLDCYNNRALYIIPIVTTKKISIQYTQKKMKRELKHVNTKINETQKKTVVEKNEGKINK